MVQWYLYSLPRDLFFPFLLHRPTPCTCPVICDRNPGSDQGPPIRSAVSDTSGMSGLREKVGDDRCETAEADAMSSVARGEFFLIRTVDTTIKATSSALCPESDGTSRMWNIFMALRAARAFAKLFNSC